MLKKNHSQKIKLLLSMVIIIAVGISTAIFVFYRQAWNKPEKILSAIQDKANISIGKIHQTSTRDGREEWSLEASSASYMNEEKKAVFQNPSLVFFPKEEHTLYLKANQGVLKTDSNNIEVSGNVVVKNRNYILETESLFYENSNHTFSTKAPVKITGDDFNFTADSVSFDLNSNKTVLKGNVSGTFSQKFSL